MRKNFTYLKTLLLVTLLITGTASIWAQQNTEPIGSTAGKFFEFKGTSNYPDFKAGNPVNWTATGTFAGGSYIKLAPGSIKSPLYKPGNNATLTFTYDVAAFGSGDNTNTVFEVYEPGNATPIKSVTLSTAKDSKYITDQKVTVQNQKNPFYVIIKGIGDGTKTRGTRLQNISLTEVAEPDSPVSELTPNDITNITDLAEDITLTGNWTAANIEALGDKLNGNQTSVIFPAGSTVAADADDWFETYNENCLKIFGLGVDVPSTWTTNIVRLDADGNATSDNITLNALFAFNTPVKITAANATFTRNGMVSGNKSTVYLPFASSIPSGFAAYTFDKVELNIVKFKAVTGNTLEANTPYLITPNGTDLNISETNVDIIPEPEAGVSTDYEFLGTYIKIPAIGLYGFKDNGFKLGVLGATVPAFRAYLKPALLPSGAPSTLSIDIDGSGTTGIENAVFEGTSVYAADGAINILTDQAQTVNIYGADGRLVRTEIITEGHNVINGLAKGMYIVNNRKVVIE